MLRVLGDDAGVADAVELDTAGVHQGGDGVFQFGLFQEAAFAQNGGGGVAQYFFDNDAHVVVGVELFMDVGHTFVAYAGGQGEFELGQSFVAQAAAKTDDGRLADGCALGDFGDGGMDKPFGFRQGAFGDFAFCARQV